MEELNKSEPIISFEHYIGERKQQVEDYLRFSNAPISEIKNYTVMAIDIVGSTQLSTKLSHEDYAKIVTLVSIEITEAVNNYHGTILKYVGDGAIAVFPSRETGEHNALALESAKTIATIFSEAINPALKKSNLPEISFRIGVDSGEAASVLIGKNETLSLDVIGNPLNIASKIQGAAMPNEICIGEAAVQQLPKHYGKYLRQKRLRWEYKNKKGKNYAVYCYNINKGAGQNKLA